MSLSYVIATYILHRRKKKQGRKTQKSKIYYKNLKIHLQKVDTYYKKLKMYYKINYIKFETFIFDAETKIMCEWERERKKIWKKEKSNS